jgi:hypothetical protein
MGTLRAFLQMFAQWIAAADNDNQLVNQITRRRKPNRLPDINDFSMRQRHCRPFTSMRISYE